MVRRVVASVLKECLSYSSHHVCLDVRWTADFGPLSKSLKYGGVRHSTVACVGFISWIKLFLVNCIDEIWKSLFSSLHNISKRVSWQIRNRRLTDEGQGQFQGARITAGKGLLTTPSRFSGESVHSTFLNGHKGNWGPTLRVLPLLPAGSPQGERAETVQTLSQTWLHLQLKEHWDKFVVARPAILEKSPHPTHDQMSNS